MNDRDFKALLDRIDALTDQEKAALLRRAAPTLLPKANRALAAEGKKIIVKEGQYIIANLPH